MSVSSPFRLAESPDQGMIRERYRALNWLIRYMDQEWEDLPTDT